METIKIINSNEEPISSRMQSVIKHAIANIGNIDEVIIGNMFQDKNTGDYLFPVYYFDEQSEMDEFLFNINILTNQII